MSALVSCIMPTADRPAFAAQAIALFLRQDYAERELVIVDDGAAGIGHLVPADPRIRYIRLPTRHSIGAKRNLACGWARGAFIAQWDDDDWYAADRLSAQAAPLLAGQADITGIGETMFLDLERWAFWRCAGVLHRRMFVGDVASGTLVYRAELWQKGMRYPDASLAEDAAFLRAAVAQGARLRRLGNGGRFIYVRHGGNTWRFGCGDPPGPRGWLRVAEPALPAADRAFLGERRDVLRRGGGEPARVLASCIMPTADRPRFVARALRSFLRQDHGERELIVLDDGSEPVDALMPDDPRIRYFRLQPRAPLGTKRNLACELAAGDVILHWDDDDWSAPWRIGHQLRALLASGAALCGLDTLLFHDPAAQRTWRYAYPRHRRRWVAGATLCYTRDFWQAHRFPDRTVGEDNHFVARAAPERILVLEDDRFYVAMIHPGNTSRKDPCGSWWRPGANQEVRDRLGADYAAYLPPALCSGGDESSREPRISTDR